jgi:hypothetical protein
MLATGWSSDYNKEGECLTVWKFFPEYEYNLDKEPRIKLVSCTDEKFTVNGKDLSGLMKSAEKKIKSIEHKRYSSTDEEMISKITKIRIQELPKKVKLTRFARFNQFVMNLFTKSN